jgi:hypothetical protein
MAYVSDSIPSLVNGVSQQPDWVRLSSQLERQDNFRSSLVRGLTVREGTNHLLQLYGGSGVPSARPFYFRWKRDGGRSFLVEIRNGDLRVWNLTTRAEATVSFPQGKAYFNTPIPPIEAFAAAPVTDTAFILNRTVTVTQPAAPSLGTRWGYVFVRQGAYQTRYAIRVNGSEVAATSTGATGSVSTETIAETLRAALVTGLGADWTVERKESVIRFRRNNNAAFTVEPHDGAGGTFLKAWFERISAFTELPPKLWDGAWVEVTGSANSERDSYYVRYDEAAGLWRESVRPDAAVGFTDATMPWTLVRNPDDTFVCQPATWTARQAGDQTSAPNPSFVNQRISAIAFHKGRLALRAGDSTLFSASGEFFRFWPETVTAQLDTDPIDVASNSSSVASAGHIVEFERKLLVFGSSNEQFEVSSPDGVLTPGSTGVDKVSAYPCDTLAAPVAAGKGVFFATKRGAFSSIHELYTNPASPETREALDTTIHVPSYISGRVSAMASLPNDATVFVLTDQEGPFVYVYKYHWEGDTKLQSSWSRWTFQTGTVVWGILAADTTLLLVLKRGNAVFLEEHTVEEGPQAFGLPWVPSLDRKVVIAGAYDAGADETVWALPYDPGTQPLVAVLPDAFGTAAGEAIPLVTIGNQAAATGNYSGVPVTIGTPFVAEAELSRIAVTDRSAGNQRGRVALNVGRLQVSSITANTSRTGKLEASVWPDAGYPEQTYTFTPRVVGSPSAPLGRVVVEDASYRIPVGGHNEKARIVLRASGHLPCSILSLDWEGQFVLRPRRV